jgi:ADP-heptose:LPS heptosyltransferase
MTRQRPALVILRALGLGDFLTGVPAYRALRAAYPDHEVVLAAPQALEPLAALTDAIDRVLPTGELDPIPWPTDPPSVAVDLHGNGPASHCLVRALGAATTMMYASAADPGLSGPWWDDGEHEVNRWCRLVGWWGAPADPRALRLRDPDTGLNHPDAWPRADDGRPWVDGTRPWPDGAVVLHPGAVSGSRRWPPDRFAAVARALQASGHRVVITGTPPEWPLARRVATAAGLGPESVAAGHTTLADLAGLVASAALLISNDTGVAHLAVAFGTPSVTLFGPVSPALWGPPAGASRHLALWHGTGGRPGDPHGARADPRLLGIGVDDVLRAVEVLRSVITRSGQPT